MGKPRRSVPADLQARVEAARLDTLALIRTLERFQLAVDIADDEALSALYELDADCAEALSVLRNPPPFSIDWTAMARDTDSSLQELPAARDCVRDALDPAARKILAKHERRTRDALKPEDAFEDIPPTMPTFR